MRTTGVVAIGMVTTAAIAAIGQIGSAQAATMGLVAAKAVVSAPVGMIRAIPKEEWPDEWLNRPEKHWTSVDRWVTVRLPSGSPAVGARVAVMEPRVSCEYGFYVADGQVWGLCPMPDDRTGGLPVTDAAGRLHIEADARDYSKDRPRTILVTHAMGWAIAEEDELSDPAAIQLSRWGRIEGVAYVGRKPLKGQVLEIEPVHGSDLSSRISRCTFNYTTKTDDRGRFIVERMFSGVWKVSAVVHNPRGNNEPSFASWGELGRVRVGAGEIVRTRVGGTGRPVVGHLVWTGKVPSVWVSYYCSLSVAPKKPAELAEIEKLTGKGALKARLTWELSAEGKAYERLDEEQGRISHFVVKQDGTFRVEDVPPGECWLTIDVIDPADADKTFGRTIAKGELIFTMPAVAGGYSEVPLDIGGVEMAVPVYEDDPSDESPEPATQPTTSPTSDSATEPAVASEEPHPTTQPTSQPVISPTSGPAPQPTTQAAPQATTQPASQPKE